MPANVCDDTNVLKGSCYQESENTNEEYEEDEIKAALCALRTQDDSSSDESNSENYDADNDDDEDYNDDVINIELEIEDEAIGMTPEESGVMRVEDEKMFETSTLPSKIAATLGGESVGQLLQGQPTIQYTTNNIQPMFYVQYIPVAQTISSEPPHGLVGAMQHVMPVPQSTHSIPIAPKPIVQKPASNKTPPSESVDEDNIPLAHISKVARANVDPKSNGEGVSQNVDKPHQCKHCGIRFQWMSHLRRHEKTHSNEKYMCNICHAGFSQFGYFKAHRRSHFAEKPYKCDKCDKRFVQSTHLKIHRMIHTGEKPYQCPICKARFTQHGNLKRHIRTHTGERPFKCTVCPASFTHSSDLTRHLRIHTGERPYKCQFCETAFATNGNLKSHLKIHTNRKAYKCTVCKASFNVESYLKAHMRTHTGERPFVCACGESFTQGLSFKFHMRARMTNFCADVSQ